MKVLRRLSHLLCQAPGTTQLHQPVLHRHSWASLMIFSIYILNSSLLYLRGE
jgi:hypothetical protein